MNMELYAASNNVAQFLQMFLFHLNPECAKSVKGKQATERRKIHLPFSKHYGIQFSPSVILQELKITTNLTCLIKVQFGICYPFTRMNKVTIQVVKCFIISEIIKC